MSLTFIPRFLILHIAKLSSHFTVFWIHANSTAWSADTAEMLLWVFFCQINSSHSLFCWWMWQSFQVCSSSSHTTTQQNLLQIHQWVPKHFYQYCKSQQWSSFNQNVLFCKLANAFFTNWSALPSSFSPLQELENLTNFFHTIYQQWRQLTCTLSEASNLWEHAVLHLYLLQLLGQQELQLVEEVVVMDFPVVPDGKSCSLISNIDCWIAV